MTTGGLLLALQRGFAADAPFWPAHDYHNPSTPFFSYLYDLVRRCSCNIPLCVNSHDQGLCAYCCVQGGASTSMYMASTAACAGCPARQCD